LFLGDLPVVISCASLALADAGIMLYDLVTAVSVVCILLVDKFISLLKLFTSNVMHNTCRLENNPYKQE